MSSTDRLDDISLRGWLDEGVDVAPERVVQDALMTIQTTRQRRELALLRRIRPMEIATTPQRPAVRIGLVAAALFVVALGATLATQVVPRIGNETSDVPSAFDLVTDLPAPTDTAATNSVSADEALMQLFETTSIRAISNLDLTGYEEAAAVSYAGVESPRRFTAAVISFADGSSAADALERIYRSALEVPAGSVDGGIGFWNVPPGVPVPYTASGGDGRIELAGSWVSFGGTSAGDQARAALLIAWREGDRVYISAGIDADTIATAPLQATVEAGVRELAATLRTRGS